MDVSSPENNPDSGAFFLRRTPAHITEPGVFDTARIAFEWLVTGPHPVALDCRPVPGLPARLVPLDELGTLLLDTTYPQPTRDAAWAALATRSRAEGGTWTVACVGLALPWLLPVAATLTARFRGDVHDIHAAVLTGFLEALATIDLNRPTILVRLRWAAYRAGYTALREALDATRRSRISATDRPRRTARAGTPISFCSPPSRPARSRPRRPRSSARPASEN
jgi:hypothetical protein